jgi:hypothetical protein
MKKRTAALQPTRVLAIAATAAVLLLTACGGDKSATANAAVPPATNAQPAVEGKATLVEFRQKSIESDPIGESVVSAVVEFEGVVTFSSDVQWSWQGPTKAGEPQKFEARAEYVNQGKGWELVPPMGIYPL